MQGLEIGKNTTLLIPSNKSSLSQFYLHHIALVGCMLLNRLFDIKSIIADTLKQGLQNHRSSAKISLKSIQIHNPHLNQTFSLL